MKLLRDIGRLIREIPNWLTERLEKFAEDLNRYTGKGRK